MPDRVYSLAEARTDYIAPVRRAEPHQRARVLPDDPSWLHDGPTLRLSFPRQEIDLFGMTIMCKAIGRGPKSVRELILLGVLPDARYRTSGRAPHGQRRLWTRAEVLAVAVAAVELDVFMRRPLCWSQVPLLERVRTHLATA